VVLPTWSVPNPFAQANTALLTKAGTGRARVGVECDELGIRGAVENAFAAQATGGRQGILPVGDAATDQRIGPLAVSVLEVRIETPALLTGFGIQREHAHERRAVVKRVVRNERCDLEGGHLRIATAVEVIPAVVPPGHLERRYILRRDLIERGVVRSALIAAPERPVSGRPRVVNRDAGRTRTAKHQHKQRVQRGPTKASGSSGHSGTPLLGDHFIPHSRTHLDVGEAATHAEQYAGQLWMGLLCLRHGLGDR